MVPRDATELPLPGVAQPDQGRETRPAREPSLVADRLDSDVH